MVTQPPAAALAIQAAYSASDSELLLRLSVLLQFSSAGHGQMVPPSIHPLILRGICNKATLPSISVVHRDVKPSNVMLDETFSAKLVDFGLARFIDHDVGMRTMTTVSGMPGYVDPESLITGKASTESDVYSFGVVVLEVACWRMPMSLLGGGGGSQRNAVFRLVEWTWDLHGRGAAFAAADERLNGEYDAAEVERVVAVGLWCVHPDPRMRLSVRATMAALQSTGPVPALPAKLPVPTYAVTVASPEGLFSYIASTSGMTSSSLTMTMTSNT